ncbi:MAG: histidinol-phosphate transaminase [Pseudomonadota bacterium]
MIPPLPHIADMAAYALADLSVPEGKRLISLSQNEALRGPSPKALAAMESAARGGHLYPDPDWTALRETLASIHGVNAPQILCGAGSLDLIGCIARAYLQPGLAALASAHAYPFFGSGTRMTGARFDTAPETDLHANVDALLAAVRPDTRIVFLANPGNPTGTRLPRAEILRLREHLRDDILFVLDEAYGEFADHLPEPMFDLAHRDDTIILRTFSKAYGLAGVRLGWGVFPDAVASQVRKLLNPNNVTLASQAAAEAAAQDQSWMLETCAQTASLRDAFADRLRIAGFSPVPSFTNFTLIPFTSTEAAQDADAFLKSEGVFLRPQAGAGLPHCLRATTGVAADMDFAATLLETWREREAARRAGS